MRRRQILWTSAALADLRAIEEYVAADHPILARGLARRLRSAVLRLSRFPMSGRIVPEFDDPEIREVISPPYRIVYSVRGHRIRIVRVAHSRRQL